MCIVKIFILKFGNVKKYLSGSRLLHTGTIGILSIFSAKIVQDFISLRRRHVNKKDGLFWQPDICLPFIWLVAKIFMIKTNIGEVHWFFWFKHLWLTLMANKLSTDKKIQSKTMNILNENSYLNAVPWWAPQRWLIKLSHKQHRVEFQCSSLSKHSSKTFQLLFSSEKVMTQ